MTSRYAAIALLILIAIVNTIGQLLMRGGGQAAQRLTPPDPTLTQWMWHSRWWLLGLALGWFCGLGWAFSLRVISLTYALPIYTGLAYVLAILGGVFILKEKLNVFQIVGILTILVGILLIMIPPATQPG